MNLGKSYTAPQYCDGCFELYDKISVKDGDYPETKIKKRAIKPIWYHELSVFDRTQLQFEQAYKQITIKLAIPMWYDIDTNCVITIGGVQHEVFNCARVISKQGYRETEITCVSPEMTYEVAE